MVSTVSSHRPDGFPRPSGPARATRLAGVAIAAVVALVVGTAAVASMFSKTAAGEVGVVRNGGPLDDNRIRGLLAPGSGLHYVGYRSQVHKYPSQQRFYTITADAGRGDRAGVDVEHDPTSDGVEVGVEGTIYFTLNQDRKVLYRFDEKFGTRQYRGTDGGQRSAWDGEDGWSSFLDSVVRPVLSNNFRETIGGYRCVELISSCVYVQNTNATGSVQQLLDAASNNVNLSKVQKAVSDGLVADVNATLGGPFLTDIRVNLVRLTLPPALAQGVEKAQASFADISAAQATVARAQAEADANRKKQAGYNACPTCGQIDTLKAIPPTITTFAPGAGFSITQPAPAAAK